MLVTLLAVALAPASAQTTVKLTMNASIGDAGYSYNCGNGIVDGSTLRGERFDTLSISPGNLAILQTSSDAGTLELTVTDTSTAISLEASRVCARAKVLLRDTNGRVFPVDPATGAPLPNPYKITCAEDETVVAGDVQVFVMPRYTDVASLEVVYRSDRGHLCFGQDLNDQGNVHQHTSGVLPVALTAP